MSARERILKRLKDRLAAGAGEDRSAAVAARLSAHRQTAPRPAQSRPEDALAQFIAKAEAADATVSRIGSFDELPAALSEELRNRNIGQSVRMGEDPALAALDWGGIETSRGPGRIDEPATLSVAPAAVAETGTLALMSGPDNPVTLTFLGETHFVALRAADIVGGYEELWERLRARGALPRTVNLVTGPSRSADIGQKLQLGAHGPVALHIFVVDDASATS